MIQFSDLTYVQCTLIHIGLIAWSIIYTHHHRNSSSPSKLSNEEISKEKQRGSNFHIIQFCRFFLYLSLLLGIAFHGWTAVFKYKVGLVRIPNLPTVWYIFRPLDSWNYSQAQYLYFLEMLGMLAWAIKNVALYICVGAWWYYSNSIPVSKKDSMKISWSDITDYNKSLFLKLSCLFQLLVFISFITMELCFTNNTILNLSIPQLIIVFQSIILMFVTIWTMIRLHRCKSGYSNTIPTVPLKRINDVSKQLRHLLFWIIFEIAGISLVDIDGVLHLSLGILSNKAVLDLCTAVFVFGYHATIVCGFCILFPQRNFAIDMKYTGPLYLASPSYHTKDSDITSLSKSPSIHQVTETSKSTSLSDFETVSPDIASTISMEP